MQYRKKPIVIDAIQWTGDNDTDIHRFAPNHFYAVDPEDRTNSDDPDCTAAILDDLHSTWVGVKTGQWIIRGVKGEYYPCDAEVFATTYEPL